MRLTRRSFLTAVAAASGPLGCEEGRPLPRTYSRVERPGIQLGTVRNALARDPRGTLARLAEIGYRDVETAGFYGSDPVGFRAALDETGLAAPSGHFPLEALESSDAFTVAKVVGHEHLTVTGPKAQAPVSLADWKKLAVLVSRASLIARGRGLKVAYRNHVSDLASVVGTTGLEILLEETDPDVDFEMDILAILRGGGNAFALRRKYSYRFRLFHLTDSNGAPAHDVVDPGAGTLDFPSILERHPGDDRFFIAYDDPKDPLATAAAGYRFLSSLRF